MASIIHPNAVPPGTPRRVRAIWAAQIDSPVDANNAAACTVVDQDTGAQLSVIYQAGKALDEVWRLGWRRFDFW
jgi:hypothetical protein